MTIFERTYVLESFGRLSDSGLPFAQCIECVVASFHITDETAREIVGTLYPIQPREITT